MTGTLTDTYLATWNETDPAARRALLDQHWSTEVSYTDPMADVAGREQLDAAIAAVQAQCPGFEFTSLATSWGTSDAHHRQARLRWGLGPAGAEPVIEGFDVVVTDDEGRIRQVLGFLDRVPAAS